MENSLYPAIWFNNDAHDALEFYGNLFADSNHNLSTRMVASANLMGTHFIGINGGPIFKPNNSISFMVICEDEIEINKYWDALVKNGTELMPLQKYPWSAYYGWLNDKYGVGWQFYLGKRGDVNNQSIVPTLMFSGENQGKCEAALHFYESLFDSFKTQGILRYEDGKHEDQIQHTQFVINGFTLMAMDSGIPQDFTFDEGVSMVIECANQSEIDYYWEAITRNGSESQCGWCKDPFGISWQVVPANLNEIFENSPDAQKNIMTMKKINIDQLVGPNN
ncbi:MAG: VOC family protein [Sphingobacterium sp.]|uniref:VOC family protein n=1 Tax=Sphingobacterium sp. JB170 TaxID=1434842 RepID=UPI00097F62FC|nr:VOC family protein [Sphingobacterium sp. JB170]SJN48352.1 3-demethylubiquinone-9 3-methyltransferase [Sphingobacterium sp. JB170]